MDKLVIKKKNIRIYKGKSRKWRYRRMKWLYKLIKFSGNIYRDVLLYGDGFCGLGSTLKDFVFSKISSEDVVISKTFSKDTLLINN